MKRRHILVTFASSIPLVSGCIDYAPSIGQSEDSPTESPSSSSNNESGYCPEVPESLRDAVPPWPEKPDALTGERAARFATRFEEAFAARSAVPKGVEGVESVHVSARPESAEVSRTDDGWLVHVSVGEPIVDYGTPTGSPHYDPGMYTVSYLVSDDVVLRARVGAPVDPRENGTEYPGEPIECPPGAWEG